MRRPYTLHYEEAVAIAGVSAAATLVAVLTARPLRTAFATRSLGAAIGLAALGPHVPALARGLHLAHLPSPLPFLQLSATLATLAMLSHGPRVLALGASLGQLGLLVLGLYCIDSNFDLGLAHLFLYGVLLGVHAFLERRDRTPVAAPARSFRAQDIGILFSCTALAAFVTRTVFGALTANGDEIANTFQADVLAHLRAYAPVPPCASMFENYWVFNYQNRLFAQYTPGWPLFMAPFQRLGVVWLAGPTALGLAAVGIARLSRRLASGLGTTPETQARIVALAGPLGSMLAVTGASMLLNGASRFPHALVCACFAWSVESACEITTNGSEPRRALRYGALLGATLALGIGTRPADGALLATGVAFYCLHALRRGQIPPLALASGGLVLVALGGFLALLLRLQLGEWWKTGYSIASQFHPESQLTFAFPGPKHLKHAIPLSFASYCWWPAAPALGIAGLLGGLASQERRVGRMLLVSGFAVQAFYFFVKFGRLGDNALGPRYLLPLVVPMAVGGAAVLAPLLVAGLARAGSTDVLGARLRAAVVAFAAVSGTLLLAPLIYPLAQDEYRQATAPLRAAARLGVKNAIILLEPGRVNGVPENLAQNEPMAENPGTLFLIRKSAADEACAREHFGGRTWYLANKDETLTPYSGEARR